MHTLRLLVRPPLMSSRGNGGLQLVNRLRLAQLHAQPLVLRDLNVANASWAVV